MDTLFARLFMRTSHAEYGQVIHELNTYYDSFKGHKTVAKCIDGEWGGDSFVYVFKNNGFDNYVIYQREHIGECRDYLVGKGYDEDE